MRFLGRGWTLWVCLMVAAALAGCTTSPDEGGKDAFGYDPLKGQEPTPAVAGSPTIPGVVPGVGAGQSATTVTNAFRVHDIVIVTYSDTVMEVKPSQVPVKPDGTITLMWNETFMAAGRTPAELQEDIRNRYVPKYYKTLTVTINAADRFFTVSGEVRVPNRYVYTGHMTVLEAIATAGGFTDFSKRTAVRVTRGADNKQHIVDCKKALTHPELNLEIVPGDIVHVKKRILFE
jgi:polysaccharide export outer membrane protein